MTTTDAATLTHQLNVRLTAEASMALRAIALVTREEYAPIVRRLLIAEYQRLLAQRGPAGEETSG